MNTVSDLNKKVTEVNGQLKAMHETLKSSVTDLGTAVTASHATLIDQMMTMVTTLGSGLTLMETELKSALAAVPTTPAQVTPSTLVQGSPPSMPGMLPPKS